jgi:hypothetical protein
MSPIQYVGVVAFLDWLRRERPKVRSLSKLSQEDFLKLATAYEKSKGVEIGKRRLYEKWCVTQDFFSRNSDEEALAELRKLG